MLLSGHMKTHELERIIRIMRSSGNASADLTPYSKSTCPPTIRRTPHSPELGIAAETSRRLACDASLVTIAHGPDGQVLGAGRRTRTVPPSLRRALEARDRGCRFPGCGLRFTEAHHVKHWAAGGETSLSNLGLLCRVHHRAVHEGRVQVCLDRDAQIVFFTPRGKAIAGAPPPTGELEVSPATGELEASTAAGWLTGIPASPLAGAPRWKRDGDIPWAVEARAWEALDSG